MTNRELSQLDADQITKRLYDQHSDAQRVIVVNQDVDLSSNNNNIANAIKEGLQSIKLTPTTPQMAEIREIEKIVIVPQIKEVEKLVIVPRIEYVDRPLYIEKIVEIEKNVFIPQIQIIEKPVVITEIKDSNNNFLKTMVIVQTVCMVALLILNLIKK